MSVAVTVAVPILDGARHLRELIVSLRAQTIPFRLVCIDDASMDDSAAIVESEGVELLRNERRLGLAGNWNRAIEVCDTPYLLIAHQDDVYEPRFLERIAAVLDAHPRAFMAHSRVQYIDDAGRAIDPPARAFKESFWPRGATYERGGEDETRALLRGNYVICPAALLRRDAIAKIGRFDERYRFVTDWEYWLRGVLAGYTIAGTSERLMRWRRHEATATASHARSLLRFEEELALVEWAGDAARARGFAIDRASQYTAARNTLLDEFIVRLAAGDRDGARALAELACTRLPRGLHATLMRAALPGGRVAGRALRVAERLYVRLAR